MAQPMVSVFPYPQLLPLKMAARGHAVKERSGRVGRVGDTPSHRDWLAGLNVFLPCAGSVAAIQGLTAVSSSNPALLIAVVLFWLAHLTLFLRIQRLQRELTDLRIALDETCTVGARLLALRKQAK